MLDPTAEAKQKVQQAFKDISTTYDHVGAGMFARFGARLAELLPITPSARVLDVATGTGAVLLPTAKRIGPAGSVTGTDLSVSMLKEARRRARAAGISSVRFRKMDAEHLDFQDETFDAVTCGFGIFFCPDMAGALSEMRRVCKAGGYVGVSVFNKTPPFQTPAGPLLGEQLSAYGVKWQLAASHQERFSPEDVAALFGPVGFRATDLRCETNEIVYAKPEDNWTSLIGSTARATIFSMDERTRDRFKDEYLAKLRALLHQDGLHVTVGVIYALARR